MQRADVFQLSGGAIGDYVCVEFKRWVGGAASGAGSRGPVALYRFRGAGQVFDVRDGAKGDWISGWDWGDWAASGAVGECTWDEGVGVESQRDDDG